MHREYEDERFSYDLGLGRHDPGVSRVRPGNIHDAIIWPLKREKGEIGFIHDELLVQLMIETQVLSFIDFQETPEFIAEIDRTRVGEFQFVEQSDIIIARDLFIEIDHR